MCVYTYEVYDLVFLSCVILSPGIQMNIQVLFKMNLDKIPISFCGKPKKFKRRFYLSFFSITKAYKEKMSEILFPDTALNMEWERKEKCN